MPTRQPRSRGSARSGSGSPGVSRNGWPEPARGARLAARVEKRPFLWSRMVRLRAGPVMVGHLACGRGPRPVGELIDEAAVGLWIGGHRERRRCR